VQSTLWERYDRSLAEISTVELAYLVGVEGRRYRPTKALAVLARLRQAGTADCGTLLQQNDGKKKENAQ